MVNMLWCQADFPMPQPLFVQSQEEQAEIMKYGNPREKGKLQHPSRPNRKKGQELWRSDRKGSTDRELLSTTSETVFLFFCVCVFRLQGSATEARDRTGEYRQTERPPAFRLLSVGSQTLKNNSTFTASDSVSSTIVKNS